MDEYVDILDESGNYTGQVCLKSEAHKKGLFHPTIHVWLYTMNKEVLLQKRVAWKETYPGYWDVSVAGHIGAGEDIVNSAVREVHEELGYMADPERLVKIGTFKHVHKQHKDLTDCEFHHIFITEFNGKTDDLVLQQSEVEEVRLIKIDEFKQKMLHSNPPDNYVVMEQEYYELLFNSLEDAVNTK